MWCRVMDKRERQKVQCCELGKTYIKWAYEDKECGPDRWGWCLGFYSSGDITLENIEYCPFCGRRVPDNEE